MMISCPSCPYDARSPPGKLLLDGRGGHPDFLNCGAQLIGGDAEFFRPILHLVHIDSTCILRRLLCFIVRHGLVLPLPFYKAVRLPTTIVQQAVATLARSAIAL